MGGYVTNSVLVTSWSLNWLHGNLNVMTTLQEITVPSQEILNFPVKKQVISAAFCADKQKQQHIAW